MQTEEIIHDRLFSELDFVAFTQTFRRCLDVPVDSLIPCFNIQIDSGFK